MFIIIEVCSPNLLDQNDIEADGKTNDNTKAWLETREDYCSLETDSCTWKYHEACLRNIHSAYLANRQGTLGEGYLTVEANKLVVKPWDGKCHFQLFAMDVIVTKQGQIQPEPPIFVFMLYHTDSNRFIAVDEGGYKLLEVNDKYGLPVKGESFVPDGDDPRWFFVGVSAADHFWQVFQTANDTDCRTPFLCRNSTDQIETKEVSDFDALDHAGIQRVFEDDHYEDIRWNVALRQLGQMVRWTIGPNREMKRSCSQS